MQSDGTYNHMSALLHTKLVRREIKTRRKLNATEVLYEKMHVYNKEAKEILSYLLEQLKLQNKNSPALKSLYQLMQKADDLVIDCAHKLAPYQSPKLESIEVRNHVEHRFVLRAPKPVANVEDWMKLTGAEKLKSDQINPIKKPLSPIEPSLYDFEEDEIKTSKLLN